MEIITAALRNSNEYFCFSCKQLRLNASGSKRIACGNCQSTDIIIGSMGKLDEVSLLEGRKLNDI